MDNKMLSIAKRKEMYQSRLSSPPLHLISISMHTVSRSHPSQTEHHASYIPRTASILPPSPNSHHLPTSNSYSPSPKPPNATTPISSRAKRPHRISRHTKAGTKPELFIQFVAPLAAPASDRTLRAVDTARLGRASTRSETISTTSPLPLSPDVTAPSAQTNGFVFRRNVHVFSRPVRGCQGHRPVPPCSVAFICQVLARPSYPGRSLIPAGASRERP